nr:immunoglobulin heavy chain junction region [Macaca mulatta]MOX91613.1 immunoglobulin heavy chain junction region [Macaca mulatta]MOX91710.1 immunoglobulin heavy chain junction region [Macaca mulatta]MOX91863.1 immunoglobulin heavy chain junction region [Macaca mulatta]MOX91915.1 immunoglobulin heavy chain junction region [Macaca mulatta]
CARRNEEADVW